MDNNNVFTIDKSSRKSLAIFGLIFGSIVFSVFFYMNYNNEKITKRNILNKERHDKIIDIFRVKKEHNYIYIKLARGGVSNYNYLYKIGDSISKKRGDSIEYIFRGDSIIKNNLFEVARRQNMLK